MELEPLVYSVRAAVAAAFLLSAGWKIGNQIQFRAVFRASAPRRLQRFARMSARAVAAVEVLIAALVLMPGVLGQLSSGAAFIVVVFFSATLARIENPALGCGCWRTSTLGRAELLDMLWQLVQLRKLFVSNGDDMLRLQDEWLQ